MSGKLAGNAAGEQGFQPPEASFVVRLLLVEDDEDLAAELADALSHSGFSVSRAADGDEGLERALVDDFDVIVLDQMLPGLDGLSVLRHLREVRDTPVLILSARDSLKDRVAGLDGGADAYLVKPFELPELIARLHGLLRRNVGNPTDRVERGELRLDLRKREVLVAGREVALTALEYGLLEVLALLDGESISAPELWLRATGAERDDPSNQVAVHIRSLRKKLGIDCIRTRRGFGYSLVNARA